MGEWKERLKLTSVQLDLSKVEISFQDQKNKMQ